MRSRVNSIGSAVSIDAWQSALVWWCKNNFNYTPKFIKDGLYNDSFSTMRQLYNFSGPPRDLLRIEWIVQYCAKRGVVPATWTTVDLFTLKECFFLILAFLSISRPFELSFTDKTENSEWEIITTGLKWGDVIVHDNHMNYVNNYLQLIIRWYKNQRDRNEPKNIWMAPPTCSNPDCMCKQLDFYAMFLILKKRCMEFDMKLRSKLKSKARLREGQKRLLENASVERNSYIFVGKNGGKWGPKKLNSIVKDLNKILKLNKNLKGYSARIGAISLCRTQQIDIWKIIKYVIWSVKSLSHISTRYMRYQKEHLKMIPFEMIHGANRPGKKCINRRLGVIKKTPLWNKEVEKALFN